MDVPDVILRAANVWAKAFEDDRTVTNEKEAEEREAAILLAGYVLGINSR